MIDPTNRSGATSSVVMVESTPRPTPKPARVPFSQVLAAGANGLVKGAEIAMRAIPGSPITATAVRGGAMTPMGASGVGVTAVAEGPGASPGGVGVGVGAGGVGVAVGTDPNGGDIGSALAQSQEMNLYYLQIQQQMNAQERSFSTLSNVLKSQHDTAKNAIGNIR